MTMSKIIVKMIRVAGYWNNSTESHLHIFFLKVKV